MQFKVSFGQIAVLNPDFYQEEETELSDFIKMVLNFNKVGLMNFAHILDL